MVSLVRRFGTAKVIYEAVLRYVGQFRPTLLTAMDVADPPLPNDPPTAPVERREPWAWVFLAAVFAILILMEVSASFETADSTEAKLTLAEAQLDAAVSIRESTKGLGGLSGRRAADVRKMLSEVARDAFPLRKDSPRASRLYAATRAEMGYPVRPEDLEPLRYSFSPSNQAIAEVYSTDSMSSEDARFFASMIEGKSISHKLARAHALELGGIPNARSGLAGESRVRLALMGGLVLLVAAGAAVWLGYFAARSRGKLEPRGFPAAWLSRAEADRVAFVVGAFLLLMGTVHLVVGLLFLFAAFSKKLRLMPRRVTFAAIRGDARRIGSQFLWAVGGLAANAPVLLIALVVATSLLPFVPQPAHPIVDTLRNDPSPLMLFWVGLAAVVMAPIVEETVFRGMLMPAIGSVLRSPAWGIVISSFLFASIHPQGVAAWLALGAVGAMCGMLTYHTRSLLPGMMLHAMHNGALLLLNLWINP